MASVKISALPTFSGNTTGSFFVMDDSTLTTTYKVTRESMFTGSLFGTSSHAITSSYSDYANNANFLDGINSSQFARVDASNIFLANQTIVGDLSAVNGTITGTLTAQKILVQTITSSREYVTGSTIFGSDVDLNTHQFTGSVTITGSLTSNTRATLNNLTGSLFGTSSWASNAVNSITSQTASYSTTLGASLGTLSNDKVRLISSDGSILSTVTVAAVTSSLTSSYSTTLGASLTGVSNDKVRLLSSTGATLGSDVTISQVTSSFTASYSTTLGASVNTLSGDKVRLLSSDGTILATATISSVTSSLTSSYSTTLGASVSTLSGDKVQLVSSNGSVLSTTTITSVTSSLTSSYSTGLGASLTGVSNDKVRLLASNGSTLGSDVTISQVTSSLTASSADSGFFVRGNTTLGNSLSNTQKITGSLFITGSTIINNPSAGATGESLIVAPGGSSVGAIKIDAGRTGQRAVMYVVSNTIGDSFGSGLQIQFSNSADDKGFGFNLNNSGDYELYTKNTLWYKGLIVTQGQNVQVPSGSLAVGNITPSVTDGRIDASNDVVAFSTSDSRLKENIKPIENSLNKLSSITGIEYDWKNEFKEVHGYEGHDVGVVAQEIEKVLPEAIRTNETGYLAVRYEKIIPLLIEAIKEQQKQIEELKNSILNK